MLPNDLKAYKADLGAFQFIEDSVAFLGLIGLAIAFLIFAPYL